LRGIVVSIKLTSLWNGLGSKNNLFEIPEAGEEPHNQALKPTNRFGV